MRVWFGVQGNRNMWGVFAPVMITQDLCICFRSDFSSSALQVSVLAQYYWIERCMHTDNEKEMQVR